MKKTENKLYFEMVIFFFIVVLCFGLLIIKEKGNSYKKNKIDKKIDEYISLEYKDIKDELKINKLKQKKNTYYKKIANNKNKDLSFTISYKNKKITSTYKKDYLEGNSLFKVLEKNMNDKLSSINNNSYYKNLKISYYTKLNNCSDSIKNKLIKGDYDLALYTIIDNKNINLDQISLQNEIIKLHDYIKSLKLNPKDYKLNYTDLNNETKSITIEFNEEILLNNINIGKLVIENNEIELNKYSIKVNHLN